MNILKVIENATKKRLFQIFLVLLENFLIKYFDKFLYNLIEIHYKNLYNIF
jgi:hypothetical protein